MPVMGPLTKEQKEYISLKSAFERMNGQFKLMQNYIDTCSIKNPTTIDSDYKIEEVFYYLLDLYQKKEI